MNHNHLTELCNLFNLGTPTNEARRVYGGLLHIMWRVNTEKGYYAVKQLSKHIDLTNDAIIKNYDLTEQIASHFSDQGIPAICALIQAGKYITVIDGTGFLVYPWINAQPLHNDKVAELHAVKIAEILAKIHLINLDIPEISTPVFDVHSNDKLSELIQKASRFNLPFASELTALQQDIFTINTAFQNTLPLLKNQAVISHGDLDQKNVLWDNSHNLVLIDWECARKLNPTHEIVNASLDWSGITTHFDKTVFIKMLHIYTKAGGHLDADLLQAAFNGVQGNWINWLVYNIERACIAQESEQKALGIEQVHQVLKTIVKLKNIIPDLMHNMVEL